MNVCTAIGICIERALWHNIIQQKHKHKYELQKVCYGKVLRLVSGDNKILKRSGTSGKNKQVLNIYGPGRSIS